MALHLKQGSSLLDDDEDLDVAAISDEEYYEEEDDVDNEEITEQVLTEKENDIVESSAQKETDDTSDPKMCTLSTFLKMSTATTSKEREETPSVEASPQVLQPVTEEPAFLQTSSPPPTENLTSERKEGSTFSDDDYEFFSMYLGEGDDKIDFEHASRDSFDAPAFHEQEVELEDVFQPAIPIEEQFLMQEERVTEALRSAVSLVRSAHPLANTRDEEHEENPLPTTPQPPLCFPKQKYSFTSVRNEEDDDSLVCNPSYTTELSPSRVSPGLITEAGVAASKIASQVETNTEKLEKMAFAIKVKMLREETKGLQCNKLVDILFGEDEDNLKMPSLELRKKLKKTIDIELTVKRFMDYKAVVDINTAEIFMKDKSALEDICRQQVMSNPLLSSLDYNNSSIANKSESPLENESDSRNAVVETTPQVVLYQELTDLLTDSSEKTDPATRLTNKISFLKKMLAFKIGNMCNINRMLNLSSFIVKQAIQMIGGGAAAERVLLQDGGSSFYSGEENPSLSGAGIGLLFGTILGGVNSAIIRSCVSVARLSMTMGVPIVMLNWPQEFKASKDYESILRESVFKFKNISNVSLSFILDSVFDKEETTSNTSTAAVSILTDKEKAKIIRDSVNNTNCNDRELFGSLFDGYETNKKRRSETLEMPMELLYQNASNVIEHKNRITDNMLSGIVDYLEENKTLLSKILNKLISKAGLAATMYYINSSSAKKNNNAQKARGKRTILTAVRRGVVGDGLSASRGRLRSTMPVIAAPQQITRLSDSDLE